MIEETWSEPIKPDFKAKYKVTAIDPKFTPNTVPQQNKVVKYLKTINQINEKAIEIPAAAPRTFLAVTKS